MTIAAKITVYGHASTVEVSNLRDDGAFLGEGLTSVNGAVVNRNELRDALAAVAIVSEGESSGW